MNTDFPLCVEEGEWWVHLPNPNHEELVSVTLEPIRYPASDFSPVQRLYDSFTLTKSENTQKCK